MTRLTALIGPAVPALGLAIAALLAAGGASAQLVPREEVPSFNLEDVNPSSATHGQQLSPRSFRGLVMAVYFTHSTCDSCRTQFRFLDVMQRDYDRGHLGVPVQLVGVNESGHESGNGPMSAGVSLPLLQDTPTAATWKRWGVSWRDVVIVDPDGRLFAVYNLQENDLADRDSRHELRELLRAASEGRARAPRGGRDS